MNIRILKDSELPNPEDRAMLCALYSRSNSSVEEHLQKVNASNSGEFMNKFYIGYGHDSIADCANITIFFEGVSMLAAVSLEHNELFSGQESSTRYIDFSMQQCLPSLFYSSPNPTLFDELYSTVFERVCERLRREVPYDAAASDAHVVSKTQYENAVKARAFDVARGFLLCGYTTNVALVCSLRVARRHLHRLRHSPYAEVRDIAEKALRQLHDTYANTFEAEDKWAAYDARHPENQQQPFQTALKTKFDLASGADVFNAELGEFIGQQFGYVYGTIDFGSYRDMHRHRTLMTAQSSPAMSGIFTLHPFYMQYLTDAERDRAAQYMEVCIQYAIDARDSGDDAMLCELDYLLPMGTQVHYRLAGKLEHLDYFLRLRSGQAVHPTLRYEACLAGNVLANRGHIEMQSSYSENTAPIYLPRGLQTITEKQ